MAPLRAHLSHLLETNHTARRVSFWYGARSMQELFYQDYFRDLAVKHPNFQFHPGLSSPLAEDGWTGHTGRIDAPLLEGVEAETGTAFVCGSNGFVEAADAPVPINGVGHANAVNGTTVPATPTPLRAAINA